jgi:voltage-gated potassium channel
LRIFEILHLRRYTKESSVLLDSLRNSWRKIFVFLLAMMAIITVFGAIIFLIEGPENGFTSIPTSMYWALVSVTTVGFGDITPATPLGQIVASVLILLGYGIIAVPTGIYTAELATSLRKNYDGRACESCGYSSHETSAKYCMQCGKELPDNLK